MKTYRVTAIYEYKSVNFVVRAFNDDQARTKAESVATRAITLLIK